MDVRRYAFTDSLWGFIETVHAMVTVDHSRAAKIVVYAQHSFSLGTRERCCVHATLCDIGLHSISEDQ